MYHFIRPWLFKLDPEKSHALVLQALQFAYRLHLLRTHEFSNDVHHLIGLSFPSRVGLAASFDKNGEYIDALATLGFGFIEIGTVTPKPQKGNPQPRLFRLVEEEAIINRMGFNSKGMMYVKQQLANTRYSGILGINLGKNADTPIENALQDYVLGMETLWEYASYFTINISSPNTSALRDLQQKHLLVDLLTGIKATQARIVKTHGKYIPIVVKISPDLSEQALHELAEVILHLKIEGVIATNTTIHREDIMNSPYKDEAGGLSGKPLSGRSNDVIRKLHFLLDEDVPIIASGGVMDLLSGQEKISSGAQLIQVYTGLIYQGPGLVQILS